MRECCKAEEPFSGKRCQDKGGDGSAEHVASFIASEVSQTGRMQSGMHQTSSGVVNGDEIPREAPTRVRRNPVRVAARTGGKGRSERSLPPPVPRCDRSEFEQSRLQERRRRKRNEGGRTGSRAHEEAKLSK